jgi:hypothetical protein
MYTEMGDAAPSQAITQGCLVDVLEREKMVWAPVDFTTMQKRSAFEKRCDGALGEAWVRTHGLMARGNKE